MSGLLTDRFYLAISRRDRGTGLIAGITRSMPRLARGEVALALDLKIPAAIFESPTLRASIEVPADAVKAPVIDSIVLDNIKQVMSQQLGVNLEISVVEPVRQSGEHEIVDCPDPANCSTCSPQPLAQPPESGAK